MTFFQDQRIKLDRLLVDLRIKIDDFLEGHPRVRWILDEISQWFGHLMLSLRQDSHAIWMDFVWATKAWLIIYFLVFIILVGWRLKMRNDYQAEYERQIVLNTSMTISEEPAGPPTIWIERQKTLEQTMAQLRLLHDSQQKELDQLSVKRFILEDLEGKLESLKAKLEDHPEPEFERPDIARLQKLLSISSLARLASKPLLESVFQGAQKDLEYIIDHSSSPIDWNHVHEVLDRDYGLRLESIGIESCNKGVIVPVDVARQSDLDSILDRVEKKIQRRSPYGPLSGAVPALMPELMRKVRMQSAEMLKDLVDAANNIHAKKKAGAVSCLKEDQVLDIIEEGLLAIYRNADLRNVLRKKVLELDPSAGAVILDADMPLPQPKIRPRDTRNLRRIIDTPMLQHSIDIIDRLVEVCGGYNDQLDQWLDSFAGRQSVGYTLVRKVLDKSGKVEIPQPRKIVSQLPKPAQDLLKKAKLF